MALSAGAVATTLALGGHARSQTPPSPPVFTPQACDLPGVSAEGSPKLRCGTVAVSRDYGHLDAGRFNLAVVVVRSTEQSTLPDPVVYISGGPGGPLTVYADYQSRHPYAPGRDLILVDQRGMGASEPNLCPDLREDLIDALAAIAVHADAATRAKRRATLVACRERAIAAGIDLKDFGTPVTAEDFDTVRQALGVNRWNVVGESYGTTVAMTLAARHPETVRSLVLDSVYPPDSILPPWSANVADARDAFFASCDGDTACATPFPHLGATYNETLERLRQAPMVMTFPPGMPKPDGHGLLTASLFDYVVGHLVYYPNFYAGLPRLIVAVHDSDTTLFFSALRTLLAALQNPKTGTNLAANVAVECRDRPRFREKLAEGADVFDETLFYGICEDWSDLGPPPVIPIDTTVPTLVLAGQFDPNARPASSRHVADLIGPRVQWVEFPLIGHSVRAFSPCASGIVARFIDHPADALDTSCASHPAPISFLPPRQR